MENSGRENIDIYLCTGKERDSSLSKTGVMWDAPFPVFSEWEIVPHEGKHQCHYYWSDQKKIPLGQVIYSHINGPIYGSIYNVYTDFTVLFLEKKWVAAGHWPSLVQGDYLKSRACYNTAELSNFNEKSSPAGLLFLGHILSAIPQEIIQPSPIAEKQMAYKKNTLKYMLW